MQAQATFNWSHVIKSVRSFVVNHVTTDEGTLAYIKLQMFETDTFHDYGSMDDLHSALSNERDEEVVDMLANAYDMMRAEILAHFADEWNFAPGYEAPAKLEIVETENITSDELDALFKEAAPVYFAEMEQAAAEREAARVAARKSTAAAITDERVAALAKLLDDKIVPACLSNVKSFKKHAPYADEAAFFNMTVEQLQSFKTGVEFYAAIVVAVPDLAKRLQVIVELVLDTKLNKGDSRDLHALFRDDTGRARLQAAVFA